MLHVWGSICDEKSHQGLLVISIEQFLWIVELVENFEKMIDIMKPFSLMSLGEKMHEKNLLSTMGERFHREVS